MPNPEDIVIGVVDVGSPNNVGWAILSRAGTQTGRDLDQFIASFAQVAQGQPAAIGFEAPMFIPVGRSLRHMTSQRDGENGRPWSAGAGATVTTIGLAVVTHVLSGLRKQLPIHVARLDWKLPLEPNELLLFEAFVSGANHAAANEHHIDALNAAQAFRRALHDLNASNAVIEREVLSLVGACMLRTAWSEDVQVVHEPCIVIRP